MIPLRSRPTLRGTLRAVAASACVLAPACSAATATAGGSATSPASASERAARADSARAYTAADVEFMRGMIHHHAQALVMSRMAPTHDASPEVRLLARRILNGQAGEIELMQDWLRDRGEPAPEPPAVDPGPAGPSGAHDRHGTTDGPHMPGMLSEEQMAKLVAARGADFDRLFLTYMIQHHEGAVVMVDELVATPGAAREEAVFRLASGIGADQSSEIARMRRMLRELLFGTEGPR